MHNLAALVGQFVAAGDETEIGTRGRFPLCRHDAATGQRVAGQYRFLPAYIVYARRALRRGVEQEAVAHHAHEHAAGVPARGGEPAENARSARFLVEVHGLRVELAGEVDDLLCRHSLAAQLERGAFLEILEGPFLVRHPPILFILEQSFWRCGSAKAIAWHLNPRPIS
jgi:hypothetical protein